MTQEEKQLLLKDLCARLPYNVKVNFQDMENPYGLETPAVLTPSILREFWCKAEDIRPYLRPMSSMTEEELKEFQKFRNITPLDWLPLALDWLLEHHFDFMGLIPKDLAIEVTKDNNPYENGL